MTRSVRKPGAFFDCFLQICRQLSFVACGMDSFRGFLFFFLPHSLLSILPCIAAVARRRRQVACPANCFFFLPFFFFLALRLLPGTGGGCGLIRQQEGGRPADGRGAGRQLQRGNLRGGRGPTSKGNIGRTFCFFVNAGFSA